MQISVIADDLTGANDCAAQFALHIDTKVFLPATKIKLSKVTAAVFDTETRDINEKDAYQRVFNITKTIKTDRFEEKTDTIDQKRSIIYKKIDSTVRGNIGSELQAVIDAIEPEITVFAPAFPQSERTTENGHQLLNGVKLENTELRNIPKSPVTTSYIPDIIKKQSDVKTAVITLKDIEKGSRHIYEQALLLKNTGVKVIVCDIKEKTDLEAVACAFLHFKTPLFVGSAGLADAIASLIFTQQKKVVDKTLPAFCQLSKILILAGSISGVTRSQCHNLLQNSDRLKAENIRTLLVRINPELFLKDPKSEIERIIESVTNSIASLSINEKLVVLIAAALDEEDVAKAKESGQKLNIEFFTVGERMAKLMGDLMSALAPSFDAFIMTGGDTAVHACQEVGAYSFKVLGEIEKGIPLCLIDSGIPLNNVLVTKAGAFGTSQTFTNTVNYLFNLQKGKHTMKKPILGITMGDAAGIGSEITVKALSDPKLYEKAIPVVFGDAYQLERAAKIIGANVKIHKITDPLEATPSPEQIEVISLDNIPHDIEFGKINAACGKGAYEFIAKAVEFVKEGKIHAIVTAPLNKEALHLGGCPHPGHTEILANLTGTKDYSMMLVGDKLRVIHVSTHVSLRKACDLVKKERVLKVIHLADDTLKLMGFENPRIAVSGLNPHCGEGGMFGTEDVNEIVPAVKTAQDEGINVVGPIAPDTVFHRAANKGEFDIVVVMYHDQGHIPLKVLGFSTGVNVTVGLPCIRTSVDHGTAFEIAGKGIADPESMTTALNLGAQMANVKFKDLLNN